MAKKLPPPPPSTQTCTQGPRPTFAFDGNRNAVNGRYSPPELCVGTLDYSTSGCATSDAAYISSMMAEELSIAGGPVNIFPLLGVHSQGSTVDQTGSGFPLSSGTPSGFDVNDAFNVNDAGWRSVQQGVDVTRAPAYLGYDFGARRGYFPPQPIRKRVSTLKIKQGYDRGNRAAQVRVEGSDDGVTWTRVDVVNLPDTALLATVKVDAAVAFERWRLVPTFFNGVATNGPWEVVELQLLEDTQVSLDNIEDLTLLENRDRDYCRTSVLLKCTYDLLDVQTELAKFGINLPQTYIFTTSYAAMILALGRPVLIGDVVELPGEIQYDPLLRPVRKWLEVTDANWSTEGYTPDWKPQLWRFYAQPIMPSVEYRDLLGLPGQPVGADGVIVVPSAVGGGIPPNSTVDATGNIIGPDGSVVGNVGALPGVSVVVPPNSVIDAGGNIIDPTGNVVGSVTPGGAVVPPNSTVDANGNIVDPNGNVIGSVIAPGGGFDPTSGFDPNTGFDSAAGFNPAGIGQLVNAEIKQAADDAVPLTGQDSSTLRSGKPLIKARGLYDGNDLYVEDALPPDGLPFTSGDALPDVLHDGPNGGPLDDGHYHRLTYANVPSNLRPPDKLVRWFAKLQRWRIIEVNTRFKPESHKATMARFLGSASGRPLDEKP